MKYRIKEHEGRFQPQFYSSLTYANGDIVCRDFGRSYKTLQEAKDGVAIDLEVNLKLKEQRDKLLPKFHYFEVVNEPTTPAPASSSTAAISSPHLQ